MRFFLKAALLVLLGHGPVTTYAIIDPQIYDEFHEANYLKNSWESYVQKELKAPNTSPRRHQENLEEYVGNLEYWNAKVKALIESNGEGGFLRAYRKSTVHRKNYDRSYKGYLPDRNTEPLKDGSALEMMTTEDYPRDHLAISKDGRIFADTFNHDKNFAIKITEFNRESGRFEPYPNLEEQKRFDHIHSLKVDSQNRLWLLDSGKGFFVTARIFAYDIETGALVHEFQFPQSVAGNGSLLNDFTIDEKRSRIYISDTGPYPIFGHPALVVYDYQKKRARRVLQDHASVRASDFPTFLDYLGGARWKVAGGFVTPKVAVDGIVYDKKTDRVYYAPNNSGRLFALPASVLSDFSVSEEIMREAVDFIAEITMTDGMTVDADGRVYLTDPEHSSIVRLDPETGKLQTIVRDSSKLQLISTLDFGPDGKLYFATFPFAKLLPLSEEEILKLGASYPVFSLDPFESH